MTLIAESDIFGLGAVLIGLAWLGFVIDGTWLGKKTSGVAWVMMLGIALSNFRIIPFESPVYHFVGEYIVPLAIPLLLFKADLRKIFKKSGVIMITFMSAACGTVVGAITGFFLLDLGAIGPKVAGVYASGWIGGSVNFISVSKAVGLTAEEFIVALSANHVVSMIALMTLIILPSFTIMHRLVPSKIIHKEDSDERVKFPEQKIQALYLTHISGAVTLSAVICATAYYLSVAFSIQQYNILLVTVLVLVIANIFPGTMNKLEGDFDLGMLAMYIFFAAMGAGTSVTAFIETGINLFFYSVIILLVHLIAVLLIARLFKFDLPEAIIGSAAALVGPAPAAAIAVTHGWKSLVTPGILCGIFGYMIGTFIGVLLTNVLS